MNKIINEFHSKLYNKNSSFNQRRGKKRKKIILWKFNQNHRQKSSKEIFLPSSLKFRARIKTSFFLSLFSQASSRVKERFKGVAHVFRRRFSWKRRVRVRDSFVFSLLRTSSFNVFRFFGSRDPPSLHPVHLPPFQSWLEAGFPRPPMCDHALTSLSLRGNAFIWKEYLDVRACLWFSYFDRFSLRLFHTFSRLIMEYIYIIVERRRRRIGKVKDIYVFIIIFLLLSFYNCNYIFWLSERLREVRYYLKKK